MTVGYIDKMILMKRNILLILALVFVSVSFSQDLKKFNLYKPIENAEQKISEAVKKAKAEGKHVLHYDHNTRGGMRNSLYLSADETQKIIDDGTPYVIRIKVNANEFILETGDKLSTIVNIQYTRKRGNNLYYYRGYKMLKVTIMQLVFLC